MCPIVSARGSRKQGRLDASGTPSRPPSALLTLLDGRFAHLGERRGRRSLQREAYPALERVAVDVLRRALTLAVGVHLERLLRHARGEEQVAHCVGSRLR